MKPTKNRVFCYACKKPKMLFQSKGKADNFIEYNSEEILDETGKAPVRSYFCELCGGYHVTSNPSIEEGERMDFAIQNKIYRYRDTNKNIDETKRIQHLISNRIAEAKVFLNFGSVTEAEDLLEICELDLDELRSLNPHGFRLIIRSSSRITKLRANISKVKEYITLDENELTTILKDNSAKISKTLYDNISNIIAIKRISNLIASIEEFLELKDYEQVKSMLTQCRKQINNFSGVGKSTFQERFNKVISNLEKQTKTPIVRQKEKRLDCVQLNETPDTHSQTQYKNSILSVIERIELAFKTYEQGNIELCETHIEIANFLIAELNVNDSNTELLNSQLAKLTRMTQQYNSHN